MQKTISLLGLSAAFFMATSAVAHEGEYDSNHIEFQRVGDFVDVDTNNDGKVSKAEYMAFEKEDTSERRMEWRENHWDEMIEKFDANEDNQIEVVEVEDYIDTVMVGVKETLEGLHGAFDGKFEFDFDDDEAFSLRMEKHMEGLEDHIAEAMDRVHESEIFIKRFNNEFEFDFDRGRGFVLNMPHMDGMSDMDENEDGEITQEEFIKGREKMFDRLDKNDDGVLDDEELEGMHFNGNFALDWHKSEEKED